MDKILVSKTSDPGSNPGSPAKYWYYITTEWCVLCSRTSVERKRMYTPKPADWRGRHEDIETACTSHFI